MKFQWDYGIFHSCNDEIAQCAYLAQLIGDEDSLGISLLNSVSVKYKNTNIFQEEERLIAINPLFHNLKRISNREIIVLREQPIARLLDLQSITRQQIKQELMNYIIPPIKASPNVNVLYHVAVPQKYVVIVHPQPLQTILSVPNAGEHLQYCYQNKLVIAEEKSSETVTALGIARAFEQNPTIIGMILLNDLSLIVAGGTAEEVYTRLVEIVNKAEQYLEEHNAWNISSPIEKLPSPKATEIATIRKNISTILEIPIILTYCDNLQQLSIKKDYIQTISQIGYNENQWKNDESNLLLFYDPNIGLFAVGRNAAEAMQIKTWTQLVVKVITQADALEQFYPPNTTLTAEIKFDEIPHKLFTGEIALVTGAASGIGKACVESLLARGAAVVGLDISPNIIHVAEDDNYLGIICDITDEQAISHAFERLAKHYGGLDMLILNAGVFPPGTLIQNLKSGEWDKVLKVNLDANLSIMREAYPLLKLSPNGGRVVVNASKNVLAPGAGAAAYSTSKAGLTQLARIAALEWGKDKIRVNIVHPDAVFDTGIWSEEVLKARAEHYGMTVQQYKTRNILGVELNSHYVAELIAEMLGPLFEKITGAQIPVDGGSDRVI